jgi:hypothetical protein
MRENFALNFEDKRIGCCITTTRRLTFSFHQAIFYQKQHECRQPTHPTFLCLCWNAIIFATIEVNEAESQAMLNTLTEDNFQNTFKKCQKPGNGAYARKGTTSRMMVASRPKVNIWPDGSTSLRNYEWLFVCLYVRPRLRTPEQVKRSDIGDL